MTSARRALLAFLVAIAAGVVPAQQERPEGWYAVVETSLGSFTIKLLPEQAPQTVAHFVGFAEGRIEFVDPFTGSKKKVPFYDGLTVHKSTYTKRFEAGDPTGTGHGMPLVWLPYEAGPESFRRPFRVGMTASSMKRINAALFFVTMVSEPYLNASHNCFGEVVEGRDVIERICTVRTDRKGTPVEPIVIRHVGIVKSGNPPGLPEPVPYTPTVPVLTAPPGGSP